MPIRLKHLATAPFDFVFNWQKIAMSTFFFYKFFFYVVITSDNFIYVALNTQFGLNDKINVAINKTIYFWQNILCFIG